MDVAESVAVYNVTTQETFTIQNTTTGLMDVNLSVVDGVIVNDSFVVGKVLSESLETSTSFNDSTLATVETLFVVCDSQQFNDYTTTLADMGLSLSDGVIVLDGNFNPLTASKLVFVSVDGCRVFEVKHRIQNFVSKNKTYNFET